MDVAVTYPLLPSHSSSLPPSLPPATCRTKTTGEEGGWLTCPRPLAALFSKGLFALLAALTHTSHALTPTAAAASVVNEAFYRETQNKSGDGLRD